MHVINFCLGSAGGHVMLKGSDLFLPTVNNYLLTGDCRLLGVSLLHCSVFTLDLTLNRVDYLKRETDWQVA